MLPSKTLKIVLSSSLLAASLFIAELTNAQSSGRYICYASDNYRYWHAGPYYSKRYARRHAYKKCRRHSYRPRYCYVTRCRYYSRHHGRHIWVCRARDHRWIKHRGYSRHDTYWRAKRMCRRNYPGESCRVYCYQRRYR